MNTILVGLNHKTAHVSIREKLHFQEDKIEGALKELKDQIGRASCRERV